MKDRSIVVKLLVAAGALAVEGSAAAQSKGQWAVSVGAAQITPHVESGAISAPALPNSLGDVGKDTEPVAVINYGITDHITGEFTIASPYKHSLYGAGAIAGTGELGTVHALPPTAVLQYRFFAPTAAFRPYLGVGVTYAYFYKETGSFRMTALTNPGNGVPTTFGIDNKLTMSAQIGAVWNFNEKWFLNASMLKTRLRTDVHFSTGQGQHMKLDPKSSVLTIGYKF
jgi:outer membrane protein